MTTSTGETFIDGTPVSMSIKEFRSHLADAKSIGYVNGWRDALAGVASGPCYDELCVLGNTTHDHHAYRNVVCGCDLSSKRLHDHGCGEDECECHGDES